MALGCSCQVLSCVGAGTIVERVPALEGREGEWKDCDFVQRQPVVVVELLMSSELVRSGCRAGSLKSSILWNS